jgi:hypothetical protein
LLKILAEILGQSLKITILSQFNEYGHPVSNWTPWYVDLPNPTKVQCLVCGEDFTKKNSRMLSHLGYILSISARDSNVKLCKNVKPDVLHAFRECGGVAPIPPEPAE